MIGEVIEGLPRESPADLGLIAAVELIPLRELLAALQDDIAIADLHFQRRPGHPWTAPLAPAPGSQTEVGQVQVRRPEADGRLMPALRMLAQAHRVLVIEDADLDPARLAVQHVAEPLRMPVLEQIERRDVAPVAVDSLRVELEA